MAPPGQRGTQHQDQIDLRQKQCRAFSETEVGQFIGTCCEPIRSCNAERYFQQVDRCRQAPSTSPPSSSHFASRRCKAIHCQENEEDVDRFELEALESSAKFARCVSVRFPSLQIIGALAEQEVSRRNK
ncbi:hypothetical protein KIN20_035080 [Parelaphostrongylus tenuis]|uniref:Uncharacterized protein n=1 Tax=Parelaphostrongylus tenuis TaxID=148309 RepID=A0AAD5RAL2_PARTN|nr:hypothetical protein KIN20_035080 [Parelaphostrongylus tenuis]